MELIMHLLNALYLKETIAPLHLLLFLCDVLNAHYPIAHLYGNDQKRFVPPANLFNDTIIIYDNRNTFEILIDEQVAEFMYMNL